MSVAVVVYFRQPSVPASQTLSIQAWHLDTSTRACDSPQNGPPFQVLLLGSCVGRLHEVQGAACLEPLDLLLVERVVDLDVERRSSPAGLNLKGQRLALREGVKALDGNPAQSRFGGRWEEGDVTRFSQAGKRENKWHCAWQCQRVWQKAEGT